MERELLKVFLVKTEVIGPGPKLNKQLRILNRLVTYKDGFGVVYEADPRHVAKMVEEMEAKDPDIFDTLSTSGACRTHSGWCKASGCVAARKYSVFLRTRRQVPYYTSE